MKKLFLILPLVLLVGCKDGKDPGVPPQFEVFSIQPLYSELKGKQDSYMDLPSDISDAQDILINGCQKLANSLTNVTYSDTNKICDKSLTKELVSTFKKNSIIVFQNHGFYEDDIHSIIASGECYPWGEETDEYMVDVNEGRVVDYMGCMTGECYTSKWIDKYCPDITGSIVYLECCYSTKDSTLANAFINKGAKAVYGNSTYVMMRYGDLMCNEIIQSLGQINPQTNKLYTTGEALQKAKTKYASNQRRIYDYDPVEECEVQLIGSSDYRLQ